MIKGYYVIDAHAHVYPEKIAIKAGNAVASFYDVEMQYKATTEELLRNGDANGIDHFLIHSVATKPEQVSKVNRYIASQVEAHKGRMSGLGTVHPLSSNMEEDINEIVSLGLHGIKIHPDMQGFAIDCDGFMEAFELCGKHNLTVLAHTGDVRGDKSNPDRIERILQALPDTTFVGAHFGGYSLWEEAVEKLPKYENFYVDTSSTSFFVGLRGMIQYINAYGIDRCMFATDYPMHPIETEIRNILFMHLKEEDCRKIFSENAIRIYNLERPEFFGEE
ncbi:MAG: amidohydrolase [Lachnospiraceae bacterium]|nr:amidohydrolase [Lachnospiraceae bacterium]